jgi:hypothetical protein
VDFTLGSLRNLKTCYDCRMFYEYIERLRDFDSVGCSAIDNARVGPNASQFLFSSVVPAGTNPAFPH